MSKRGVVAAVLAGLIAIVAIASGGSLLRPGTLDAERPSTAAPRPDLDALHRRMLPLFELDGIVYTDHDEESGRLVVAVENRGLATAIHRHLRQLGVPTYLVDIIEAEPIADAATLQETAPSLAGGLQINYLKAPFLYSCTLGFNAQRGDVEGFVTNSHCTQKQGGVESTAYYQIYTASAPVIGTETADPAYFTGGICPNKKKCRYSDSAFVARTGNTSAGRGTIAKTTGANNGSLTIDGSFAITGEGASIVGQTVNKVGRTTGWTQGAVTATNVNVAVQKTNIVLLGQTMVSAGVGSGDSGSPVFTTDGDSAVLVGILWGGTTSGASFVFSPIANIETELGGLSTCATGC